MSSEVPEPSPTQELIGGARPQTSAPPGRSWNYRVIEFVDFDDNPWFAIHEVHYEDGVPISYSENPAVAVGADADELLFCIEQFQRAFERDTLVHTDFRDGSTSDRVTDGAEPGTGRLGHK